jgi:signal transduction histidine kinase
VVKKIAETHGGRVSLESRAGHGAKFQISFPRP